MQHCLCARARLRNVDLFKALAKLLDEALDHLVSPLRVLRRVRGKADELALKRADLFDVNVPLGPRDPFDFCDRRAVNQRVFLNCSQVG